MTMDETAAYAASPQVSVLRNDTVMQAVMHHPSGVVGVNFWNAGSLYGVASDGAASVMLQQSGQDLFITVSEPTWKRTSQVITLAGDLKLRKASLESIVSVQSDGTKTTITINSKDRWGQAVELQLRGELDFGPQEGVEQTASFCPQVTKMIQDGQLLIRSGNRLYNAFGQRMN